MSPTIHVSDETWDKLSQLKRDDETWDEFLSRLTDEEHPIEIGAWSDDESNRAHEAVKRSRESFER